MSEYIKRLKACIRWFVNLEDGYLADQGKLRGQNNSENARHTEFEARLSGALELFKAANLEMTTRRDSLEESLNKEKFDRLLVVESYEKEREERESVEASLDVLKVDLERVPHEAKWFSEQKDAIWVKEELRKEVDRPLQ